MNFLHSDLGTLAKGSIVVARLSGTEANVMLLDDLNLDRYRRGRPHEYYGGHFRRSPARIPVPKSGQWNLVIDLGGYAGTVEASVTVIAA